MELLVSCTSYTFINVLFFLEISQGAIEGRDDEQGYKQNEENDAYLAHELANQQDDELMEQEDDPPIADDDGMADQPDSDDEDNALEQKDHDDNASMQGKTCLLHEITIIQPIQVENLTMVDVGCVPAEVYLHKLLCIT